MIFHIFYAYVLQAQEINISREVLFGNPEKTNVQISSDAKYIFYLAPHNGVLNLFVSNRENQLATPITNKKDRGIDTYKEAGNPNFLVYLSDNAGDENDHIHSVNIETKQDLDLTPYPGAKAKILKMGGETQPNEMLILLNKRNLTYFDVYKVDITSGAMQLVEQNDQFDNFIADSSLNVRFAVKTLEDGSQIIYSKSDNGDWEIFEKIPFEDVLETEIIGVAKDGRQLFIKDSRGRDKAVLSKIDLISKEKTVLAEDPKCDLNKTLLNPKTLEVDAASFAYQRNQWHVINPKLKQHFETIQYLSRGDFSIDSRSSDDHYWIVRFENDVESVKYFLFDTFSQKATFLYSERPKLQGHLLAPMLPKIIKSRDGLDLVSYLTLPNEADPTNSGKPNKPLPLILLVRGGPWVRDYWRCSSMHQWFADRGYAVLSVNYRGSTGFGKKFIMASEKEWAGKMHDDLIDAVNWAINEGIADQKKVAIFGKSYGGYEALVGMTFTPKVFACGIDMAGVADLLIQFKTRAKYNKPPEPTDRRMIGDYKTVEGRELLISRSPTTYVSNIQKPLLIAHGENDTRVNRKGADKIVEEMLQQHIPVTYILVPNEGHGLPGPENNFIDKNNRIAFFALVEQFLAKHLHGRNEPLTNELQNSTIKIPVGEEHLW